MQAITQEQERLAGLCAAEPEVARAERQESSRFLVGQRLEEHRIDDGENSRSGADAQRERDDRRRSDGGRATQRPQRVANVLPENVDEREAALIAVTLSDLSDAAKVTAGSRTRLGRRQPAMDVFVSEKFKMSSHLLGEPRVVAHEQSPDAGQERTQRS